MAPLCAIILRPVSLLTVSLPYCSGTLVTNLPVSGRFALVKQKHNARLRMEPRITRQWYQVLILSLKTYLQLLLAMNQRVS